MVILRENGIGDPNSNHSPSYKIIAEQTRIYILVKVTGLREVKLKPVFTASSCIFPLLDALVNILNAYLRKM